MIIKYGTSEIDLNTINSPMDAQKLCESIDGQNQSVFGKRKESPVGKDEILFDQCTEKEIALRNLSFALKEEYNKLKSQMFPASVGNLIYLAKQNGNADMVNVPAVDTEEYGNLQKMAYLSRFIEDYTMFLIQARVGFGINLSVSNNGQVYALKDLRELHSKAL